MYWLLSFLIIAVWCIGSCMCQQKWSENLSRAKPLWLSSEVLFSNRNSGTSGCSPIKTNTNSFSIHLRVSILLCAHAPESTSIRTPAGDRSNHSCTLVLPAASRSGGCKEYPIGNPTLPSDKYPGALGMTSNFSSLIWAIMRLFPRHWFPLQSSWRSPSRMDVGRGCWRNWDIAGLPSQVHGGKARVSTDVKCCFSHTNHPMLSSSFINTHVCISDIHVYTHQWKPKKLSYKGQMYRLLILKSQICSHEQQRD